MIYTYLPLERVLFGTPAAQALDEEVESIGARRVFIVASRTLATQTPLVGEIRQALGARSAGLFDRCVAHTRWPSFAEAVYDEGLAGHVRLTADLWTRPVRSRSHDA